MRMIDAKKAIEIIEAKQKELCPVGRYGRNYVYGSDREKYDAWEEIIDALDALPTLTPPNEWVSANKRLPGAKQQPVIATDGFYVGIGEYTNAAGWLVTTGLDYEGITHWMPLPAPPDRRPPEGEKNA